LDAAAGEAGQCSTYQATLAHILAGTVETEEMDLY